MDWGAPGPELDARILESLLCSIVGVVSVLMEITNAACVRETMSDRVELLGIRSVKGLDVTAFEVKLILELLGMVNAGIVYKLVDVVDVDGFFMLERRSDNNKLVAAKDVDNLEASVDPLRLGPVIGVIIGLVPKPLGVVIEGEL